MFLSTESFLFVFKRQVFGISFGWGLIYVVINFFTKFNYIIIIFFNPFPSKIVQHSVMFVKIISFNIGDNYNNPPLPSINHSTGILLAPVSIGNSSGQTNVPVSETFETQLYVALECQLVNPTFI